MNIRKLVLFAFLLAAPALAADYDVPDLKVHFASSAPLGAPVKIGLDA